ncbi:MAG: hypothetical protein V4671_11040 [Armatimonadota bacterium]
MDDGQETSASPTAEDRRRYAAWLGSRTSAKKAAASRANGAKGEHPGRPLKPLEQIACTCGRGQSVPLEAHTASCTVTMAIERRRKRGVITGGKD